MHVRVGLRSFRVILIIFLNFSFRLASFVILVSDQRFSDMITEGRKSFDYAGCLECGTCRIICGDTIIKKWAYPGPTMGVEYRFG